MIKVGKAVESVSIEAHGSYRRITVTINNEVFCVGIVNAILGDRRQGFQVHAE